MKTARWNAIGGLAACMAGAALLGGSAWAEEPDLASAAKGKIVYQRYCGSCHGREGRGDGVLAQDLTVAPPDLTVLAKKNGGHFPFDKVVEIVDGRQLARGHGAPDMPVWGEVFPKTEGTESHDVKTVVGRLAHYLWSIQR